MQYCPSMSRASQSSPPSELTAGVDIGTTAVKAVVADQHGSIVRRARLASKLLIGPDGRFEHDAVTTWWEAPRAVLQEVLSAREAPLAAQTGPRSTTDRWVLRPGPPQDALRPLEAPVVQAVAVAAMMPSVAAVDATGRPLGAGLLYGDWRGDGPGHAGGGQGDPTTSHEMAQLSGWVARNDPGAAGYWPAQAVANASLGGPGLGGVTDLASAFAAGPLFNGSGWDTEVCAAAGLLPSHLPRVAVFGEAIGKVEGLPDLVLPGPELAAGSVDGLCEQLVAGTVNDGDVFIGLGSALVVWLTVPGWPPEQAGVWRLPHVAAAGKALVGGASNAGGMWVDWVDRVVRPSAEPGLQPGDVPVWWPWGKGERVPWHDRSLRIGLTGADLSHGPAALRRAALEATGFVTRYVLELASSATGTMPKRFVVTGGGTRNRAWLQAIADVLGQPVAPMAVPETAALGAAFLARMAVGLERSVEGAASWARYSAPVEPAPGWSARADERYLHWRQGLPTRA